MEFRLIRSLATVAKKHHQARLPHLGFPESEHPRVHPKFLGHLDHTKAGSVTRSTAFLLKSPILLPSLTPHDTSPSAIIALFGV